jgi:hypothetical protein
VDSTDWTAMQRAAGAHKKSPVQETGLVQLGGSTG